MYRGLPGTCVGAGIIGAHRENLNYREYRPRLVRGEEEAVRCGAPEGDVPSLFPFKPPNPAPPPSTRAGGGGAGYDPVYYPCWNLILGGLWWRCGEILRNWWRRKNHRRRGSTRRRRVFTESALKPEVTTEFEESIRGGGERRAKMRGGGGTKWEAVSEDDMPISISFIQWIDLKHVI